MTTGQRIKNRRIELDLSVDDIANALGKNRATIYRYESDEIENLPTTVLEPLAKILKTTPAELMGWKINQVDYVFKDRNHEIFIETQINNEDVQMLLGYFYTLNDVGKKKILDTIEDLAKIYSNTIELKAAHNDKATDPEEVEKMEQDLKDLLD